MDSRRPGILVPKAEDPQIRTLRRVVPGQGVDLAW